VNREYGERTKAIRATFEAIPDEAISAQTLYERMGAASVGQAEERKHIRNALPALVRLGFVKKVGLGSDATYQATGRAKKRVKTTPAELAGRKRRRNPLRPSAAAAVRTRAARVAQQAANTPAPAKPKAVETGETVDQFLARGGRVQRLRAHWERMERAV
jgi:hypothetical protein